MVNQRDGPAILQMVRVPLWTTHETSGLVITNDFPLGLVPRQFSSQHIRQITQHTQVGYTNCGVDIHDRSGPGLDAVKPILLVSRTSVDILRFSRWLPLPSFLLGPCTAVPPQWTKVPLLPR